MLTAQSVRDKIPLPKMPNRFLGWVVLALGLVILYDAYDGRGREASFPLGSILPW